MVIPSRQALNNSGLAAFFSTVLPGMQRRNIYGCPDLRIACTRPTFPSVSITFIP
jgi:hypothetical protein